MFGGVSVLDCHDIVDARVLRERVRLRGNTHEMFFLYSDADRVLPVYRGATTQVLPWGARPNHSQRLPPAAWLLQSDLEAGRLDPLEPEQVVVRASRALDNGTWYEVAEGVLAVLVTDGDRQAVYPLVEEASAYYRGMTGSAWMPCLLRQRI